MVFEGEREQNTNSDKQESGIPEPRSFSWTEIHFRFLGSLDYDWTSNQLFPRKQPNPFILRFWGTRRAAMNQTRSGLHQQRGYSQGIAPVGAAQLLLRRLLQNNGFVVGYSMVHQIGTQNIQKL